MKQSRNTRAGDVLSEARALADQIGLELAVKRASQLADLVAFDLAVKRATSLLDQLDGIEVHLLPVDKRAAEQQIVFGVVAEPGTVDAHGDTIRAEVIEVAAHNWLAKFQNRGLMHRSLVNDQVQVFESYIAPVNLKIGGKAVKKGTWLLMYKILDSKLWAKIRKGELTGFSLGGFGRRIKLRS